MSVIFPPVILGPEMAAPIVWAPGIFWFFLLENPVPVKSLVLEGGGVVGFLEGGGVEAPILFKWAWGSFRQSTPSMTGRRFHSTMEMIPALSW